MSTTPTTAAPRLPSLSEIERQLREKLPGLTVYNPSTDWVQLEIFGLTNLWACPDLGGEVHPHPITETPITCDGKTMVRGKFLTQKDSSGKVIEGQDAPAMVKVIVSPEKYGQMGFVWLPGVSEKDDEDLKKTSRAVFLGFQRSVDEMIVGRRAEFKSNWSKSGLHKGEPCPPPTAAENAAMDRLQERKRATVWKYECEVVDCPGYATNEWEKFDRHMRSSHKVTMNRSNFDGEVKGMRLDDQPTPSTSAPIPSIAAAAEAFTRAESEVESSTPQDTPQDIDSDSEPDRPVPSKKKSSSTR